MQVSIEYVRERHIFNSFQSRLCIRPGPHEKLVRYAKMHTHINARFLIRLLPLASPGFELVHMRANGVLHASCVPNLSYYTFLQLSVLLGRSRGVSSTAIEISVVKMIEKCLLL